MSSRFPGRHLSVARVFIAVGVVACIVATSTFWVVRSQYVSKPMAQPWFAGYADVTNTPSYPFESAVGQSYDNVVLGFIVAGDGRCSARWGGHESLESAATELDLDSRVAQLQKADRTVTHGFCGQAGVDLATARRP